MKHVTICGVRDNGVRCRKPVQRGRCAYCADHARDYERGRKRVERALESLRVKAPHLAEFLTA